MKKSLWLIATLCALLLPGAQANAANSTYGQPDEIPQGNILHAFSWPLKDIRAELPNIAAAGFGAIQISPLQRGDINEGWTWYTIYLPYDYHIMNSPGMGTKEDLKALCKEAEQYGIKIVVDVVLNHVNKTEPYFNPWFNVEGRYRSWGLNNNAINWNSRESITHDPLGDYVELNTENSEVIARAKAYIEELKACGVKGIRFDAAKHIEIEGDCGHNPQFWNEIVSVSDLWFYGEIVGQAVNGSDAQIAKYSEKGIWVPDPEYTGYAARENGGIPTAPGGGRDNNPATLGQLVYYGESHDDYSNDEWSEKLTQGIVDRAYCAYACRNKQTALYYSRPRSRGKDDIKISKGSTAFMGKHIVEVNKFRNAMVGKEDYFAANEDGNACSITRKDGGAVIIMKGSGKVGVKNGGNFCPDGTYIDRVSGGTFTVANGGIQGTVGPSGVAVIYKDANYKETPTPTTVTITGSKKYNVAYADNFLVGDNYQDNNYIHYWNSSNKNIGTTWPGVKMERAKGSDGKYYWCYYVPDNCDMVVFNNGTPGDRPQEGEYKPVNLQSADLKRTSEFLMNNGGATITPVIFEVGSFEPETVTTTQKTVTIEGDYNITYSGNYEYIHYWGGAESSDWPGVKMTQAKGDDGKSYWCYKVPAGTTGIIFTNGVKEDARNEKTADLTRSSEYVMSEAGKTEVKVIFTLDGKVIDPEEDPVENLVKIYGDYNLAYSGSKENVYYWGGASSAAYPGIKMATAKGSDGKNYKVAKVADGTSKVLFNTNGDENKTGDISYSFNSTYNKGFVMTDNGQSNTPVQFIYEAPELSDVYVYVDGWANEDVYIYLYSGGDYISPWPGVEMSIDDATGYWVYQVPKGYENANMIVNYTKGDTTTQYPAQNEEGLSLDGSSKILHIKDYKWNNYPESGNTDPKPDPTPGNAPEPEALPDVVTYPTQPTGTYCYFVNSNEWSNVYVYSWDSNGKAVSDPWPGTKINTVTYKVTDNLYKWSPKSGTPSKIVISNGINEDQPGTDRAKYKDSGDLTFVNKAIYSVAGVAYGNDQIKNSYPTKLYMQGNFEAHSWDPTYGGFTLEKVSEKGIYLARGVEFKNDNDDFFYFSFSETYGGSNNEDWNVVNSKNRWGAYKKDASITVGTPTVIVQFEGGYSAGDCNSWKVDKGTYDVIVDLYNMTVTLLQPQSAASVEALQLAEVQKETASSTIGTYDYVTYPATGGKAYGVKVNGNDITATEISVSEDIYHNASNVLFTEKVLVTTSFTGTSGYTIEPMTASYGNKQLDGKFRSIKTLDNLDETTFASKVNYYYTVKTPVDVGVTHDVKVPMQSPAGSATVQLAVPEPKLIHSGVSVEKSQRPMTFTYQGHEFNALYNIATKSVEIEEPNITSALEDVAGTLFRVKADGANMTGSIYHKEIISPSAFESNQFTAPTVDLHTYDNDANIISRWEASTQGNIASSISMTYEKPKSVSCNVKEYRVAYAPVVVNGYREEHLIATTTLTLDVETGTNTVTAYDGNDNIKSIELDHGVAGDWYLVEFLNEKGEVIQTNIVEGMDGARSFTVTRDLGQWYAGQLEDAVANRWYDKLTTKVRVSTLYPFAAASRQNVSGSLRKIEGSAVSGQIVETEASDEELINANDEILTGIEGLIGEQSGEVMYFNTQGIRVARPDVPGVYVVREANGKTLKIVVR